MLFRNSVALNGGLLIDTVVFNPFKFKSRYRIGTPPFFTVSCFAVDAPTMAPARPKAAPPTTALVIPPLVLVIVFSPTFSILYASSSENLKTIECGPNFFWLEIQAILFAVSMKIYPQPKFVSVILGLKFWSLIAFSSQAAFTFEIVVIGELVQIVLQRPQIPPSLIWMGFTWSFRPQQSHTFFFPNKTITPYLTSLWKATAFPRMIIWSSCSPV